MKSWSWSASASVPARHRYRLVWRVVLGVHIPNVVITWSIIAREHISVTWLGDVAHRSGGAGWRGEKTANTIEELANINNEVPIACATFCLDILRA